MAKTLADIEKEITELKTKHETLTDESAELEAILAQTELQLEEENKLQKETESLVKNLEDDYALLEQEKQQLLKDREALEQKKALETEKKDTSKQETSDNDDQDLITQVDAALVAINTEEIKLQEALNELESKMLEVNQEKVSHQVKLSSNNSKNQANPMATINETKEMLEKTKAELNHISTQLTELEQKKAEIMKQQSNEKKAQVEVSTVEQNKATPAKKSKRKNSRRNKKMKSGNVATPKQTDPVTNVLSTPVVDTNVLNESVVVLPQNTTDLKCIELIKKLETHKTALLSNNIYSNGNFSHNDVMNHLLPFVEAINELSKYQDQYYNSVKISDLIHDSSTKIYAMWSKHNYVITTNEGQYNLDLKETKYSRMVLEEYNATKSLVEKKFSTIQSMANEANPKSSTNIDEFAQDLLTLCKQADKVDALNIFKSKCTDDIQLFIEEVNTYTGNLGYQIEWPAGQMPTRVETPELKNAFEVWQAKENASEARAQELSDPAGVASDPKYQNVSNISDALLGPNTQDCLESIEYHNHLVRCLFQPKDIYDFSSPIKSLKTLIDIVDAEINSVKFDSESLEDNKAHAEPLYKELCSLLRRMQLASIASNYRPEAYLEKSVEKIVSNLTSGLARVYGNSSATEVHVSKAGFMLRIPFKVRLSIRLHKLMNKQPSSDSIPADLLSSSPYEGDTIRHSNNFTSHLESNGFNINQPDQSVKQIAHDFGAWMERNHIKPLRDAQQASQLSSSNKTGFSWRPW